MEKFEAILPRGEPLTARRNITAPVVMRLLVAISLILASITLIGGQDHNQSKNAGDKNPHTISNQSPAPEIKQAERAEGEAVARDAQFAEQLTVSRDAAIAASRNAQAIINAERAWVMVGVNFRPGSHLTKLTSGDGSIHTGAMVEINLQNCGPTPAWVFEQWICLEVANFVVMSMTEWKKKMRAPRSNPQTLGCYSSIQRAVFYVQ